MKRIRSAGWIAAVIWLLPGSGLTGENTHTPLKIQNAFERPEQVLDHFIARDSEGFVWSGLLEKERTEFTTWKQVPRRDAHYLADSFKITPVGSAGPGRAEFLVRYSGVVQVDAAGTEVPLSPSSLEVTFVLVRQEGKPWRISAPDSERFSPVLLRKRD